MLYNGPQKFTKYHFFSFNMLKKVKLMFFIVVIKIQIFISFLQLLLILDFPIDFNRDNKQ